MNRPKLHSRKSACGRWGIRTPGTVNPHVSLANWWFQPLTQPSLSDSLTELKHHFSNASAKVTLLFHSTKFFGNYFSNILIFACKLAYEVDRAAANIGYHIDERMVSMEHYPTWFGLQGSHHDGGSSYGCSLGSLFAHLNLCLLEHFGYKDIEVLRSKIPLRY